jgi:hypothetical protein
LCSSEKWNKNINFNFFSQQSSIFLHGRIHYVLSLSHRKKNWKFFFNKVFRIYFLAFHFSMFQ